VHVPLLRLPRAVRVLALVAVAALAALVSAAPAQAAAYRYWGYYQLKDGAWAFAQKGPADTTPADGSVEGWRFAVADQSSTRTPRVVPTFDQLCHGTTTAAGDKLVGIVVDFGRPADSADGGTPPQPKGTCVSVPTAATGYDVLTKAGFQLRIDKGLTCGIDGWPATGCGDAVATVPAAAASPDTSITLPARAAAASSSSSTKDDGGGLPPAAWIGIVVAVFVVGGLAFVATRRSRALEG
jgi:hypothetical protein